jgi:porphobilinogen synthase
MFERPRRNRKSKPIRQMVRETQLTPSQLVQPIFMIEDKGAKEEIKSLPGQFRLSLEHQRKFIEKGIQQGLNKYILFPAIREENKDAVASYSYSGENFYLHHASEIKKEFGDEVCLISDVAMDPYSSDGHDGIVENGKILNDPTLEVLSKMAVTQAQAGFDIIGPSDMMDGRVAVIRDALDEAGYSDVSIMSYTAKYASAMYGPFRDALDSAPKEGDKKTYQMDPANRREAQREAQLDIQEGADFIMVKPALHYMDIISDLKALSEVPVVCYHVSGECAMLLAAAEKGWLDYKTAMPETLLSLKRAGADIIITYFAYDYAKNYA